MSNKAGYITLSTLTRKLIKAESKLKLAEDSAHLLSWTRIASPGSFTTAQDGSSLEPSGLHGEDWGRDTKIRDAVRNEGGVESAH